MHFLEIATTQPCLQNSVYAFRLQSLFSKSFVYRNEKRLPCTTKSPHFNPRKAKNFNLKTVEAWRAGLSIESVATLERSQVAESNERQTDYQNLRMNTDSSSSIPSGSGQPSWTEDSPELDEREMLRRQRISKANKGNTPWNKGRKHSPETLRRIKERTRLAMQDPKVKRKLASLGHSQSEETRIKIGLGVRMGWEKRREKSLLQETCLYEWQNLIADASRKGLLGEGELQWDSYKILAEQLEQEWLQSVEQRRQMPRPKGSKRAPKSLEQRRKISEAIAAKWADPDYRNRVYSGLAKYHGIQPGVERKPRRRPSGGGETRESPPRKKDDDVSGSMKLVAKNQVKRIRLRKSKVPKFKDPLASSKLEILKNIKAQRAAADSGKIEAIARAKALIAEAEKAAKALEAAAEKSPLAQASLIETRKLIAEAILSIESIELARSDSDDNGSSFDLLAHLKEEANEETGDMKEHERRKINGTQISETSTSNVDYFGFKKSEFSDMFNGRSYQLVALSSTSSDQPTAEDNISLRSADHDPPTVDDNISLSSADHVQSVEELNNEVKHSNIITEGNDLGPNRVEQNNEKPQPNGVKVQIQEGAPPKPTTVTKKWVRGRLVEVVDD